MEFYDHILQGHEATKQNALDHALQTDWQDIETTQKDIPFIYMNYVDTINGIDIYYNMGTHSYLFSNAQNKY